MAFPLRTLLSAIQRCLEEDAAAAVAAAVDPATANGPGDPLPPPLPDHVIAALRRDDGTASSSLPVFGDDGEPPPAPQMCVGVPRAPLAAALAKVLATWAAAGAFPLVFAPLSPFKELPVDERGAWTPGMGATAVLTAAAVTPATREAVPEAVTEGVATTAASMGGGGGVTSGHHLPRPVGVPDMDSLTPTVVALVHRITESADAHGDGGGSESACSDPTAGGIRGHDRSAPASALPSSHPAADDAVATARLLLRSLGAACIARCLGCRTTPTTIVGALPPPAGALVAAAAAPHRPLRRSGPAATPSAATATITSATAAATPRRPSRPPQPQLTVAGRALMKHLGRRAPGWGTCYWGTEAVAGGATTCGDGVKNAAAAAAVGRILADAVWLNGVVVEARVPEGYGARWAWDADGGASGAGRFRGFLEPHILQPRPWEEGTAAGAPAAVAPAAVSPVVAVGATAGEEGAAPLVVGDDATERPPSPR
ncbi:hypothetical protein MMPV_001474 [Pyropia vietnamensis]